MTRSRAAEGGTSRADMSGMSYVEMMVALAIVTLVLIVAGGMLVALGRQAEAQGLRSPAVGGVTDLALDQLERDLREALSIGEEDEGGVRALVLETGGQRVRWTADGATLRRRREVPDGPSSERVVATNVALVEWRARSTHLYDVLLRRDDETLRQRTVLLRNIGRAAPPEAW